MLVVFFLTDGPLSELTLFSSESGEGDMNSTALANMSFSEDERTGEDRESGTEDQADEDREERNSTIVVDKSIRKRKTTSHEEEPLNKVMGMLKDLKEQHEGDKGKNDEEKETLYSITKLLLEQAQKQQQERSYWVFFCWFLPENFLVWNWFRQIVKKNCRKMPKKGHQKIPFQKRLSSNKSLKKRHF